MVYLDWVINMEEKIKINISPMTMEILSNDMEKFAFSKNNKLQQNAFLNILINNYYQEFIKTKENQINLIDSVLQGSNKNSKALASEIAEKLSKNDVKDLKPFSVTLNFKPSHIATSAIEYICYYCLKEYSLSEFLRMLLVSYTRLHPLTREKIIFKDFVENINQAINKRVNIIYRLKENSSLKQGRPIVMVSSKEELFNYLILKKDNVIISVKLSNFKYISLIKESYNLSQNDLDIVEKMQFNNPSFLYQGKEEEIHVQLTYEGERMYSSHYIHRPPYIKKDNGDYYFNCSYFQAFIYFQRFGKEAIIVSPKSLQKKLLTFYQKAAIANSKEN